MDMSEELKAELTRRGWNPDNVRVWGERLDGDMHGVTIRLPDGETRYISGPFAEVKGGDQIAIVRFC